MRSSPLVGFTMYELVAGVGFILRLMIDRAHEGKGYGRSAMAEVIRRLRLHPEVSIYDFDSGGPGWRSLEFQGIYNYALYNRNDHWDAFLHGYSEIRRLSQADLTAIPYFVLAYALWGTHMDIVRSRWHGTHYLNDEYFDERIGQEGWWRQWENKHLAH